MRAHFSHRPAKLPNSLPRKGLDPPLRVLQPDDIEQIISAHSIWLASKGHTGTRANFFSTDLNRFDFAEKDLRHAKFGWADLRGATFRRSRLAGALLYGADLRYADFSGIDGRKASFVSAHAQHARFTKANLRGSFFIDAHLERTQFVAADLSSSRFYDNVSPKADFRWAVLDGLDLRSWHLSQSQIRGAYGTPETNLQDGLTLRSSKDRRKVLVWRDGRGELQR